MSRSDQLNFMDLHWVFTPHLVTGLRDVIELAGHLANGKTALSKANYIFLLL